MKMINQFIFFAMMLRIFASLTVLVHCKSGFISMCCGCNNSGFYDSITNIMYKPDLKYIDTGEPHISLRSFPEGIRNCYTLPTSLDMIQGSYGTYLIRANFLYGDYDGKNQLPVFDLHIGANMWDTVSILDSTTLVTKEIIHFFSSTLPQPIIHICLINTGSGTPFISSLELRPMDSLMYYASHKTSCLLSRRLNFGSTTNTTVRYADDIWDRIWEPIYIDNTNMSNSMMRIEKDDYDMPNLVSSTTITPRNADEDLVVYANKGAYNTDYVVYLHFTELQQLHNNQSREFNIFINGEISPVHIRLEYLSPYTFSSTISGQSGQWLNISLSKTKNSTLGPIISAIEMYNVRDLSQPQTYEEDASAMMNIKSFYRVKKNWQGDPCAPKELSWNGVQCNYTDVTTSRINRLDLSSSGLTGEITSYISNLTLIQYLDLSNNSLTGKVPNFLSQLSFLTVINLTKNNLTGPLPEELHEKSRKGLLTVSMDDNLDPCFSFPCNNTTNNINNNNKHKIVAVVASVGALLIIMLIALTTLWAYKRNRLKGIKMKLKGRLNDTTARQFTYLEILSITNDLKTVIGKGGFGPVYHGYLEGTEVAVKMLSASSRQGYKEFRAEIDFLTRVHHVNLTSLVGYCNEGDKVGLIYEYMANGNLKQCLSDKHPNLLSWEERLRIAVDAATALEYLHHGCKPPIIHRDVKSDNILLDQKFQAKLGDFGLSRNFPADHTHVSTAVAGTLGYLDPEYYISYRLTEKSDIFSFGVVLLEIITGQPVLIRDETNGHITQRVSFILGNEDIAHIIDPRLGGEFEMNSLKKVIDVAMACASPTSALRPGMNSVVMELNHCLTLEMTRTRSNAVTESASILSQARAVSMNFDSEISLVGR